MSLETTSTAPASESATVAASPAESSAVETTNSGSGYSVVDPGYEGEGFGDTESNDPPETSGDASGEETAEETVVTPTVEAAEPQEISDELLDKALELGYTEDDLRGFSDVASLEKEISRAAKLHERWQQRQAVNTPATEPPAAKPDVVIDEEKPEPDWENLIELGHDPDIVALNKESWNEARQAKAMLRELVKKDQQRSFEAQCQRFDDTLNNIGDEFKPLFGTGSQSELLASSKEQAANRQAVFDKMNMLRHGYLTAGQRVPPEADLIQEAVHASFYKHSQQTARTKLMGDIKKASSQSLSRPNSGGAKPLSGQSLALQKEQQYWSDKSF